MKDERIVWAEEALDRHQGTLTEAVRGEDVQRLLDEWEVAA